MKLIKRHIKICNLNVIIIYSPAFKTDCYCKHDIVL